MKKSIFFASLLAALAANAQAPYGDWNGKLKVTPQQSLSIVFHLENKDGEDKATMDSPDQNAYGIPAQVMYLSADSVNLTIPQLMFVYEGRIDRATITGTLSQRGMKFPLELVKGEPVLNRPQTPCPPYPYGTEDLTITNPEAESSLAGTLVTPTDMDSAPLVIMVSGSGLQDRNEELFGHKPFAVIADWLGRNGVASFRYDDRGYGQSTGDVSRATTADFAAGAAAVLTWFRQQGKCHGPIGILGHSEGGQIAYMLAASAAAPDFIVSVAGPTVRGDSISAWQNNVALAQQGIDSKTRQDFCNAFLKISQYRLENPKATYSPQIMAELYPQYDDSPLTRQLSQLLASTLLPAQQNAWLEYFFAYSPADDLNKMHCPAFIIFGEKDMQVPPALCLEAAQTALPEAEIKSYPGLNHMMQHAGTGQVEEYGQIEETFSQEVLDDILDFVKRQK